MYFIASIFFLIKASGLVMNDVVRQKKILYVLDVFYFPYALLYVLYSKIEFNFL